MICSNLSILSNGCMECYILVRYIYSVLYIIIKLDISILNEIITYPLLH